MLRLIDWRDKVETGTPFAIGKGPFLLALTEDEAMQLFDMLGAVLIDEVDEAEIRALLEGARHDVPCAWCGKYTDHDTDNCPT